MHQLLQNLAPYLDFGGKARFKGEKLGAIIGRVPCGVAHGTTQKWAMARTFNQGGSHWGPLWHQARRFLTKPRVCRGTTD